MSKKAVVIGGGIIGLSCAYQLIKNDYKVTILEKGLFGMGCSRGNAGLVCPTMAEPLPAPGLVGTSIKWMMKKDSPLYIKPSAFPKLSGWLTQFMKHCNESDFQKGEEALLHFSSTIFDVYDALEEDGFEFECQRKGFLFVFLNENELKHKYEIFKKHSEVYGYEMPVLLSKEEVLELEPNLTDKIFGGIILKNQRLVRPETLTKAYVDKLTSLGADMHSNTEVAEVEIKDGKVVAVMAGTERFEADQFLLATGAWSNKLAKKFGYNLPIQAGKGYSITLSNPNATFSHALYLGDSRAVLSPFQDNIRMGGTMELSGFNTDLDKNRIQSVRSAIAKYMREEIKGETEFEWTGMRPMVPDGLPVFGKIPKTENAFIATGHCMEGVSMGPITGKVMGDLMAAGETDLDISLFSADRFAS